MTPEWQDAFRYAMTLADQLGLDAAALADGEPTRPVPLPIPAAGDCSWIRFEYPAPQRVTAQGVTFAVVRNEGKTLEQIQLERSGIR